LATDWYMEGLWMKNCNCDPGCPCDFNQRPTQGYCQGMAGMHVTRGHYGEIDLSGVTWGGLVRWPGALHEGNGEILPIIDASTNDEQRNALFQVLSGQEGDTFMEVFAYICPTVHEPVIAPIDFAIDLSERKAHFKVDGVVDAEIETLRGINPPEPYRILVRIPDGMEYTGPNEEAETALAKHIKAHGAIEFEVENGHSTLAFVRHGSDFRTGKHEPIVVEKAFA
jgi:hypothetical protein